MQKHKDSAVVQEKACGTLINLSLNSDSIRHRIAVANGIAWMHNHDTNSLIQEYACRALHNLSLLDATREHIVARNGIARFVRAVELHKDSNRVQEKACEAHKIFLRCRKLGAQTLPVELPLALKHKQLVHAAF